VSAIRDWGSTAEERAAAFPCDRLLPGGSEALYRAVDVDAPAPLVFSWLCQLRAAPYSYDWLDNLGRTSPRERDPRNEELSEGQRVMLIFRLAEFRRGEHLTLFNGSGGVMGRTAVTYSVRPRAGGSRLVVKLLFAAPWWSPVRWILPAGDFVMMRKQLLTLKALAERDAARPSGGRPALSG
jgi:hypothetical protein